MNGLPTPYERGAAPPAAGDLDIPSAEDRDLLRQALDLACSGLGPDASDEARLLRLLKYVAAVLRPSGGSPGAFTASAVLAAGEAACDGFCKAFGMLCRLAGLPSRDVGLYNVDGSTGHNLCEVWAEDGWRLFDPMYGVFFVARSGDALCLHDLLARPGAWTMIQALPEPWGGWTDEARLFEPRPAAADYMGFAGYALPRDYARWLGQAYPATYRGAATCFPLTADLRERREAAFGCGAEAQALSCGAGTGSISVGFAFAHTLIVRSLPQRRLVEIGYEFWDRCPDLRLLPLSALHVLSVARQDRSVRFVVRLAADEGMALAHAETFGRIRTVCVRALAAEGQAVPDEEESRLGHAVGG